METPKPPVPAILDYASPKLEAPLRLAAKSVVTVTPAGDGVDILEKLTGQPGAIVAMVFTGMCVGTLGCILFAEKNVLRLQTVVIMGWSAFYLLMVAITIAVMLAVVNSTWRRTILEARSDRLSLIFSSPFKTRRFDWRGDEIRKVSCISGLRGREYIHEIRIEAATDLLRLFTGHYKAELDDIAAAINEAWRLPPMAKPL